MAQDAPGTSKAAAAAAAAAPPAGVPSPPPASAPSSPPRRRQLTDTEVDELATKRAEIFEQLAQAATSGEQAVQQFDKQLSEAEKVLAMGAPPPHRHSAVLPRPDLPGEETALAWRTFADTCLLMDKGRATDRKVLEERWGQYKELAAAEVAQAERLRGRALSTLLASPDAPLENVLLDAKKMVLQAGFGEAMTAVAEREGSLAGKALVLQRRAAQLVPPAQANANAALAEFLQSRLGYVAFRQQMAEAAVAEAAAVNQARAAPPPPLPPMQPLPWQRPLDFPLRWPPAPFAPPARPASSDSEGAEVGAAPQLPGFGLHRPAPGGVAWGARRGAAWESRLPPDYPANGAPPVAPAPALPRPWEDNQLRIDALLEGRRRREEQERQEREARQQRARQAAQEAFEQFGLNRLGGNRRAAPVPAQRNAPGLAPFVDMLQAANQAAERANQLAREVRQVREQVRQRIPAPAPAAPARPEFNEAFLAAQRAAFARLAREQPVEAWAPQVPGAERPRVRRVATTDSDSSDGGGPGSPAHGLNSRARLGAMLPAGRVPLAPLQPAQQLVGAARPPSFRTGKVRASQAPGLLVPPHRSVPQAPRFGAQAPGFGTQEPRFGAPAPRFGAPVAAPSTRPFATQHGTLGEDGARSAQPGAASSDIWQKPFWPPEPLLGQEDRADRGMADLLARLEAMNRREPEEVRLVQEERLRLRSEPRHRRRGVGRYLRSCFGY